MEENGIRSIRTINLSKEGRKEGRKNGKDRLLEDYKLKCSVAIMLSLCKCQLLFLTFFLLHPICLAEQI